ncbi:hypothetical protein BIW11_07364 [Tropilaelaps mercedesae]|uniref:Uncharacterized protein n=1 Tax=Tropilaelaps mercedesae TaxID=418985 RepID=A0A1V9XUN1_9ACAR|nr:hypothetical protein BIW11_07364 [Tropilaelaps mercedesae]
MLQKNFKYGPERPLEERLHKTKGKKVFPLRLRCLTRSFRKFLNGGNYKDNTKSRGDFKHYINNQSGDQFPGIRKMQMKHCDTKIKGKNKRLMHVRDSGARNDVSPKAKKPEHLDEFILHAVQRLQGNFEKAEVALDRLERSCLSVDGFLANIQTKLALEFPESFLHLPERLSESVHRSKTLSGEEFE